jgi:predicted metal-dependent hydrolase
MNKRERISQWVGEWIGDDVSPNHTDLANNPFYLAFFRCWNEQRYYEAHDVLEQLWLKTDPREANFFKGLIQAAGAFVHLQKRFEHPSHAKHSRRLPPAVRLFRSAEKNLASFKPWHHRLDVTAVCQLLNRYVHEIVASDYTINPWCPETAPKLKLM